MVYVIIKIDTSKKDASASNVRLGFKKIIILIFFGLTIGFGTSFVGISGGTMMLVVFIAFIAFIAHSMINPTIILER